ncbi:hypothetical protein PSYJYH_000071 [Bacillus phage PSYJ-YH]|nr:hypothetical protein PSYJYH_000071 [Bacillus phage PSYJ-YH]
MKTINVVSVLKNILYVITGMLAMMFCIDALGLILRGAGD